MLTLLKQALNRPSLVQSFSGVRTEFGLGPGIPPDLAALAMAYAYCYARDLPNNGRAVFLLGRDPRPTGLAISKALARGFAAGARKAGYELTLYDLGIITTPLAEVAVQALHVQGGVMVTASHNPIADNGFKFLTGYGMEAPGTAPPGALLSAQAMAEVIAAVRRLAGGEDKAWEQIISEMPEDYADQILHEPNNEGMRMKAERAYLDQMGADWGMTPHCLKPLTMGPVLVDPNGGAGCGIGARVLEHFGVRAIEINAELGYPEHGIDTDGIDIATGRHMLLRVSRAAARYNCHFGVAFDYDADRGNLVLPGYDEAAIIPPQKVAAFNVAMVLARRTLERAAGLDRGPLAIVASDATSLVTHRIAAAFQAEVHQVETGEINVVSKMHSLRAAGYDVPIGVEGANGGSIFASATCRDGLQAALSAAQAESRPDIVETWLEARRRSGETAVPEIRSWQMLPDLLATIPLNANVAMKLSAPPMEQKIFKERLERFFHQLAWPKLQSRFRSFQFQNFEGTEMVAERTGDESGAWRVLLTAAHNRRAFVFIRGSRTEAGVWRLIVDADHPADFPIIRETALTIFEAAGKQ
ncbi:MAG TPA: hypothetical protein GXX29_08750 [Firmicutes bacterium]|nr:hypothetical protein [Bacillota bacterium]